jgi:hypothetical protein
LPPARKPPPPAREPFLKEDSRKPPPPAREPFLKEDSESEDSESDDESSGFPWLGAALGAGALYTGYKNRDYLGKKYKEFMDKKTVLNLASVIGKYPPSWNNSTAFSNNVSHAKNEYVVFRKKGTWLQISGYPSYKSIYDGSGPKTIIYEADQNQKTIRFKTFDIIKDGVTIKHTVLLIPQASGKVYFLLMKTEDANNVWPYVEHHMDPVTTTNPGSPIDRVEKEIDAWVAAKSPWN